MELRPYQNEARYQADIIFKQISWRMKYFLSKFLRIKIKEFEKSPCKRYYAWDIDFENKKITYACISCYERDKKYGCFNDKDYDDFKIIIIKNIKCENEICLLD